MEGSNILFYSSKFLWACGRGYSKFIDNLGKTPSKMFASPGLSLSSRERGEDGGEKNNGIWADLTVDHVQWQVLLL